MKKLLAMAALFAVIFTACSDNDNEGNETPDPKQPVLTCTSASTLEFDAEGGSGVITYTLQNPAVGTELAVTENADWITNLKSETAGRITFTVSANDDKARSTSILVSYATESFSVKIKQEEGNSTGSDDPITPGDYDVEVELSVAFGEYYGTMYTTTENYYIVLSDNGLDSDGYLLPNSVYYILDIYSNQSPSSLSKIQIPAGTYRFDYSDSAADGTMGTYYSYYSYTDEAASYEHAYTDATLVVKADGSMDLVATLDDGTTHHATFSGDYALTIAEEGGGDESYSMLEADYTLDLEGLPGYAEWYGDYYECGYGNWYIYIETDEMTGDSIILDLIKEGLTYTGDPTGVYTAATSLTADTFIPGFVEEYEGETYTPGSWMLNYESYLMAPLYNGTVTITRSGDLYTITINCTDDATTPHAITGSWSGRLEISNEASSLSRRSAKRAVRAANIDDNPFRKLNLRK